MSCALAGSPPRFHRRPSAADSLVQGFSRPASVCSRTRRVSLPRRSGLSARSPVPRRHGTAITPQPPPCTPRLVLQALQRLVAGRVPPIPPRQPASHDLLVQAPAVRQDHLDNESSIPVTVPNDDHNGLAERHIA